MASSRPLACHHQAVEMAIVTLCTLEEPLLQSFWDYLHTNCHDTLRSPLCPVILSVSTYFILFALYTVLDVLAQRWHCINKNRIHPEKLVTWKKIWTTWVFMMFGVWISMDDHYGYDFPWSLHNLVPFSL
ncbi:C25L2 protein, partial [Polyodon spathula]|nr:C25L2 protein [Polyodon spathula]